jgi:uncharacterized membrane protein YphA (DoxX/SURF4 family)
MYPLLILGLFSDLGRFLVMFIPFFYVFAARGFNIFLEESDNKDFIKAFMLVYLLVYFSYLTGYYYWPTLDQMACSGERLCRNIILH